MTFALPRTLTLPSGVRITLRETSHERLAGPPEGAPLFSEVMDLFYKERVAILRGNIEVDVLELPLADFHVVRAVLTKAGLVHEDEALLDCKNCGEELVAYPCRNLETGPWEDGELGDPELDATAELGVPLEIAPIRLGRVRHAITITLAPRTVRQALPFWAAAARHPLEIDDEVVRAMGIVALGSIRDASRIAPALAGCDAAGIESLARTFLAAHYPPRLASDVFCPKCKARSTIDAPLVREFEIGTWLATTDNARPNGEGEYTRLPPLDEFVELAHGIAEPLIAGIPGETVELIVESGTPAVDDGGEPLLGSYEPPPPTDSPVPTRPPTVTIYYRTFEKIELEEGPFDWKHELYETIEHELEHHIFYLRGDDPMDEEEHAEIDREVVRVVGRREATRRTLAGFGSSIPDFVRRAWPLIALGALALSIGIAEGRCN